MKVNRHFAVIALLSAAVGLSGCASPGGLAFWKGDSPSATAAPDIGQQRFDGLSQFAGNSARPGGGALGATPPAESDNLVVASWKKTTAAVTGALAAKPAAESAVDDPLRLDRPVKKVGPEVYIAAASLLENQGRFAEAEAQYQKALQASPNNLKALVALARLHDRQGKPQEAVAVYRRALKAHPDKAIVHNDLGLCYARQHQLEASIQALEQAVALEPGNAKYRNNLATVFVEAGRVDQAVKLLSTGSSQAVAHYNVGCLLHQRGRTAEAVEHCRQALRLDPNLAPALELLARLEGRPGATPDLPAAYPTAGGVAQLSATEAIAPEGNIATTRHDGQTIREPAYDDSASDYTAYMAGAVDPPAASGGCPVPTAQPQWSGTISSAGTRFHIGDEPPAPQPASDDEPAARGMRPLPPIE